MDLAVEFEQVVQGGGAITHIMAARMRVLPAHMMPLLRHLVGLTVPPAVHARLEELVSAATDRGVLGGGSMYGRAAMLQTEIREEIREALDELTEERP
jgi:hypothetical protein